MGLFISIFTEIISDKALLANPDRSAVPQNSPVSAANWLQKFMDVFDVSPSKPGPLWPSWLSQYAKKSHVLDTFLSREDVFFKLKIGGFGRMT